MKKRTIVLWILTGLICFSVGCAPKVPYRKPHKRLKHCGCELITPANNEPSAMCQHGKDNQAEFYL